MVISFFYIDYVEFLSANRVLPSHFWSSLLFFFVSGIFLAALQDDSS